MTSELQRAVLVLGAGRSGTSIIARATQVVGVDLGHDFKPPSRKNPTGFFEDSELLRLSKKLRRALGLRPDSLKLLDDSDWHGPIVEPFYNEFEAAIRKRFGHAPIWGFKYARTMRLLPFWVNLFDRMHIQASYVMPIRNPLSVARSRSKLDEHRGNQENSDLEWLANVVPYFKLLTRAPLVVVDYDNLINNPTQQLERIAALLELPIEISVNRGIAAFTHEFLQPGLQHTRFTRDELVDDPRIHQLVKQAYPLLQKLSEDEMNSATPEFWYQWQSVEEGVEALRPLLAHIDGLNQKMRMVQWNPFSFLVAAVRLVRKLIRNF